MGTVEIEEAAPGPGVGAAGMSWGLTGCVSNGDPGGGAGGGHGFGFPKLFKKKTLNGQPTQRESDACKIYT
jgi:hypothetical protein